MNPLMIMERKSRGRLFLKAGEMMRPNLRFSPHHVHRQARERQASSKTSSKNRRGEGRNLKTTGVSGLRHPESPASPESPPKVSGPPLDRTRNRTDALSGSGPESPADTKSPAHDRSLRVAHTGVSGLSEPNQKEACVLSWAWPM